MATKIKQVAISVAMVIPEMGFDDEPMMPTIREDTVTKKKPKTTTNKPMTSEPGSLPGKFGKKATMATITTAPPTTKVSGRSRSVRCRVSAPPREARSSFSESRNDETMV